MGRHEETTVDRVEKGSAFIAEVIASGLREPIGDAPADFDDVAKECWDRYSREMERFGFADRSHRMSLELLCRTYSEWLGHLADVRKNGTTIMVEGTRGPSEIINPAVKAAKDCRTNMNTFLGELMWTPNRQSKAKPPKVDNSNTEPTWED